jgi:ribosomal protein L28
MIRSTATLKHVEMYRAGEYWILDNGEAKRFLASARAARAIARDKGLVVVRAKNRDRMVPQKIN